MCAFLGITTDRMRIVGSAITKNRRNLADSLDINIELLDDTEIGTAESGYDSATVFTKMDTLTKKLK